MQNVQRIRFAQFKWLLTFYILAEIPLVRYKGLSVLAVGCWLFGQKLQSHVAPIDATYAARRRSNSRRVGHSHSLMFMLFVGLFIYVFALLKLLLQSAF